MELALLLGRLERLNEAVVAEACRRHGLGASELRVLAMLCHGRGGPISPTTISSWIVQTSGGLTATLRRLENDGHIERQADPEDGRGRLVKLTESGRAAYDATYDDMRIDYERLLVDVDATAALGTVRELVNAFEQSSDTQSSVGWVLDKAARTMRSTL